MTREELMNERKKLVEAVVRIDKEIADFDNKISKGKKEKICRLLRKLYNSGDIDNIEIKTENISELYLAYFNFDEFINKYNILKNNVNFS